MILREFRPYRKNTLHGFATVELSNGLVIHDISMHEKNGKRWVGFPGVPQLQDGMHRHVDGKPQYKRVLEWTSKGRSDRFSEEVWKLIPQASEP